MGDAWLVGIDFPGVEIEDRAVAVAIDLPHRDIGQLGGQHPKETTAGRQPPATPLPHRHRQLDQVGIRQRPPGIARRLGPAIMVVA